MSVGLMYNGALARLAAAEHAPVDFFSIIPERCWMDFGRRRQPRFVELPDEISILDHLRTRYPLAAHGIGLSIASASTFDLDHVRQLAEWHRRYEFSWISEHLSAVRVRTEVSADHHAGLALPLPWDQAVLDLLCERVCRVQDTLRSRLLLENGVVHTPVPEQEMSEVEFLNALTCRTGCALLLDLHNLFVNSVNLGIDADAFVDGLDLGTVVEIHVAGGNELYGVYLDSHAGRCPPAVWRLLDRVLPGCTNLRGITFEFHESYYPQLGDEGVLAEVAAARRSWAKSRTALEDPCRLRSFSAPSRI